MALKKSGLFVWLLLVSLNAFGQLDADKFQQFQYLKKGDVMLLDIENIGCHVKYKERIIFYGDSSFITIKRIEKVNSEIFLDGVKIGFEEYFNLVEIGNQYITYKITKKEYLNFLEEFKYLLINGPEGNIIAGDTAKLDVKFNDQNFTKEFRGWIAFTTIPKSQ